MRIICDGPTRKNVFKQVAQLRSEDAEVLLKKGRVLGAVYLLGYSIECYLKFAACERNEWARLPKEVSMVAHKGNIPLYVHDWPLLVEVARIRPSLEGQREMNAIYSALVEGWGPNLRYRTAPFPRAEGQKLYKELGALYEFLKDLIP